MKKRFILFLVVLATILSLFTFPTMADEIKKEAVPEITARNVLMINTNTGAIVYEKDADDKIYPASLTKLVTMLVATDLIKDYNEVITVSKSCYDDLVIGSANINLQDGEQIKVDDLLYAIAISSANEATNALAIHYCGSISAFVEKMNAKVTELGLKKTHFVNTHGLHDEQHYTTARDMSIIAKAAFSNERVMTYLSTPVYTIEATNKTLNERLLDTTNSLIRKNRDAYYKYCKAGKTGTTSAAGYNLISIASKNDIEFLLVAMNVEKKPGGTNTVFRDSKNLYEWGFKNYKNTKILSDTDIIKEIKVRLSASGDYLVLLPEENLYSVIPIDMDITTIEQDIVVKENIEPPIAEGEILGTITLKKDGVTYASTNLIAGNSIERHGFLYALDRIHEFFNNTWVRIICLILIILLMIYIILMIVQNRQNKQKRRKRLRRHIRF